MAGDDGFVIAGVPRKGCCAGVQATAPREAIRTRVLAGAAPVTDTGSPDCGHASWADGSAGIRGPPSPGRTSSGEVPGHARRRSIRPPPGFGSHRPGSRAGVPGKGPGNKDLRSALGWGWDRNELHLDTHIRGSAAFTRRTP
jgi:hypothetical protein